MEANNMSLYKT